MRRVLLLAALAAPALGLAQAAGEVAIVTTDGDDAFINIDECAGVGETGDLDLAWNVLLESGASVTGGFFRVFASNKAPATTLPRYCLDDDPTNGTYTYQVGVDTAANTGSTSLTSSRATADFVHVPPFDCTEGAADRTVHVCVEYYPSATSGRQGGAVRQLVLSLRRPAAPTGVSATPGDGALNLSWSGGTGGDAETRFYRVVVKDGATTVSTSDDINATSLRVEGLQNLHPYDVEVWALSESKNLSDVAGTTTGTPMPVDDFWDYYRNQAGAHEQGGCGAGGTGPLALLGVAAFLALSRRRK
jgi:uncharacterized protein (TIGR03382 family)